MQALQKRRRPMARLLREQPGQPCRLHCCTLQKRSLRSSEGPQCAGWFSLAKPPRGTWTRHGAGAGTVGDDISSEAIICTPGRCRAFPRARSRPAREEESGGDGIGGQPHRSCRSSDASRSVAVSSSKVAERRSILSAAPMYACRAAVSTQALDRVAGLIRCLQRSCRNFRYTLPFATLRP